MGGLGGFGDCIGFGGFTTHTVCPFLVHGCPFISVGLGCAGFTSFISGGGCGATLSSGGAGGAGGAGGVFCWAKIIVEKSNNIVNKKTFIFFIIKIFLCDAVLKKFHKKTPAKCGGR